MNKKIKYFLISGLSLAIVTYLAELIFLITCKDGLGCLAIGTIYQTPGVLIIETLNLTGSKALTLSSICFYFLLGGIMGISINKLRGKNK